MQACVSGLRVVAADTKMMVRPPVQGPGLGLGLSAWKGLGGDYGYL